MFVSVRIADIVNEYVADFGQWVFVHEIYVNTATNIPNNNAWQVGIDRGFPWSDLDYVEVGVATKPGYLRPTFRTLNVDMNTKSIDVNCFCQSLWFRNRTSSIPINFNVRFDYKKRKQDDFIIKNFARIDSVTATDAKGTG